MFSEIDPYFGNPGTEPLPTFQVEGSNKLFCASAEKDTKKKARISLHENLLFIFEILKCDVIFGKKEELFVSSVWLVVVTKNNSFLVGYSATIF